VGPDSISYKMLKSTKETIVKSFTMLFNRSLSENTFPSSWKIAYVIPLFKKEHQSIASNHRPVSLLACVSKIMERIIFKHVYNYFYCNDLFYRYQAGFLPGHSTVYYFLEIYHSIVRSIDDGKLCCMVFVPYQRHLIRYGIKVLFSNYKLMV
jgi:sarcosine oxidase/L-pipecolate oxidase